MYQIKVLGTGCPKCKKLAELTEQAAKEMKIEYQLEKITDIKKIMEFQVMLMPALVVNGIVKLSGKIPSDEELKKYFTN